MVLPFGAKCAILQALAIPLMIYLTYYLLTTVLGAIGLWPLGESFAHLGRVPMAKRSARDVALRRVAL